MVQKTNIKDIAQVYSGYAFRGAVKPEKNGDVFVLQAKDIISNEPVVDTLNLTQISLEIPRSNAFIQKGDILLISRATGPGSFKSTIFQSDANNVIASSSLFIIRITDKSILPEYVSLYLNHPDGQNALSDKLSGSYIKNLPKQNLEDLKIPIPELSKQKSIVDLAKNIKSQEKITERKNQLKRQIINSTFNHIIAK